MSTFVTHSFAMDVLGSTVLVATEGVATVAGLEAFERYVLAQAQGSRAGVGLLLVVRESASVPKGAERARLGACFAALQPRVALFAAVIEGGGLGAIAKRALFTVVSSAVLRTVPTKISGELAATCEWFAAAAPKAGLGTLSAPRLRDRVDALPAIPKRR